MAKLAEKTRKAGRPTMFGETMVRKTITLPREQLEFVEQLGGDSFSAAIRVLIEEYRKEQEVSTNS